VAARAAGWAQQPPRLYLEGEAHLLRVKLRGRVRVGGRVGVMVRVRVSVRVRVRVRPPARRGSTHLARVDAQHTRRSDVQCRVDHQALYRYGEAIPLSRPAPMAVGRVVGRVVGGVVGVRGWLQAGQAVAGQAVAGQAVARLASRALHGALHERGVWGGVRRR